MSTVNFGMRSGRWRAGVAVLVLGGLLATAPGAAASTVSRATSRHDSPANGSAEPVLTWNAYAEQAASAGRAPASTFLLLGITHVAIYDTTVALGLRARPFLVREWTPEDTSAPAAVATAAHDVLAARVPAQRPFLDSAYTAYLTAIPDGDAKQHGILLGRRVAERVLAWRADDGFGNQVTWVQPPPGPGVWEPTAPAPPVDLVLTQVRPLALRSNDQFRPGGPPALTSRQYARDFDEVQRLGRADSAVRTPYQTETARFWSDQTAVQWNRAVRGLAADRALNLGQAARLLTMVTVSAADALIACFDAKYAYVAWRPVHAIQRADTDGNASTTADPAWQALLNVNHPEYPSGHACATGAVTTALQAYFGRRAVPVTVTSTTTGTSRSYDSLGAVLDDVTEARIVAGLHFRFSMRDGQHLGRSAANWVLDPHFAD
jgi:membrane-associated phospholipid phosphatase